MQRFSVPYHTEWYFFIMSSLVTFYSIIRLETAEAEDGLFQKSDCDLGPKLASRPAVESLLKPNGLAAAPSL